MPRAARIVAPGVPHHVTQRGNRRGTVFFDDADRRGYIELLQEYTARHAVAVLAYCLMNNHVHLVVVPPAADALHLTLKPIHMQHAQRINRTRGWSGHLWQGRYFSSPLDEPYLWAAIRYVELNPVRAGMVLRAEAYRWSSAQAHCGLTDDPLLTTEEAWQSRLRAIDDWSGWLAESNDETCLDVLRRRANKGLPCGSDEFVAELGRASGRNLTDRPQGRRRASGAGPDETSVKG